MLFVSNSSKLPASFLKKTEKVISPMSFSSNDIAKIIRDLDPNNAHGHDMINIFMLKISFHAQQSISKPSEIILNFLHRKRSVP